MSNDKIVPRKTVVTRSINMKINPAQYETFDVGISLQQEIEWTTNEELLKKSQAFSIYANLDFQQFLKTTLERVGLDSIQGTTAKLLGNSNQTTNSKDDFDQLS